MFPRAIYTFLRWIFRSGENGLNSGNAKAFFLSRVLTGEDTETRVSRTFTSYIAFAPSVFIDFFQNNVPDNNYVFHIF